MKAKKFAAVPALVCSLLLFTLKASGWGDEAHMAITRAAVGVLPGEFGGAFKANEDFVAYHSLDPDIRTEKEKALPPEQRTEGRGHYIDIDLYGNFPFAGVPHSYEDAARKFGRETVDAWGVLPWRVEEYFERAASAMKEGKWEEALLAAASLSHYVADAHVPFHFTYNYNGQFSGNLGIHARFDVETANRVLKRRRLNPSGARVVPEMARPAEFVFSLAPEGYVWIDNILLADLKARRPEYDETYYAEMLEQVGDLTYERMTEAAEHVAGIWVAAWEKAGRPKAPQDLRLHAELVHSYSD